MASPAGQARAGGGRGMRGRRPAGPEYVEKLAGPEEAKRRLVAILRTVAGPWRIGEACAGLGVCESRFHELREEALQGAVDALAPRPPGPQPSPGKDPRVGELERELEEMRQEVEAAQVREEIALV